MAEASANATVAQHGQPDIVSKRDFLKLVTVSGAAIGAGALAWPFIASMNPSRDVLALSAVEVDLTPIQAGSGITVVWRGKPIFVRHRTEAEIKTAVDTPLNALIQPVTDADRVKPGHAEWVVVVGICTHLGCVPRFDPQTDGNGWLCPCHNSHFDLSGRVLKGSPAPYNLPVPPYAVVKPGTLRLGENPAGSSFSLADIVQI